MLVLGRVVWILSVIGSCVILTYRVLLGAVAEAHSLQQSYRVLLGAVAEAQVRLQVFSYRVFPGAVAEARALKQSELSFILAALFRLPAP